MQKKMARREIHQHFMIYQFLQKVGGTHYVRNSCEIIYGKKL